jgi:hypothetical protein
LAPYLVPVSRDWAGELLLQDSVELALREACQSAKTLPAPRGVAAWLFVDPAKEVLLKTRLSSRAKLGTLVHRAEESLFRYWDPRVFAQLPRVLGAEVFPFWLAMDVCWCWLDATGTMQQMHFVAAELRPPSTDPKLPGRLRRIAEVNQCLVHTEKAATDDPGPAGAYFDLLLVHAENAGCRTPVDRMTYAVLADSLGKGFEHDSLLSTYLERFHQGEAAFSACAADVPQDVWDSVRNARQSAAESLRRTGIRS